MRVKGVKKHESRKEKVENEGAKKPPVRVLPSRKKAKARPSNLGLYANLAHKRLTKKDTAARKRAEYLASLPKNPIARFFVRLSPKHFFGYWFSKRGLFMMLKIIGVGIVLLVLGIFGLFMYFKKDLDLIRPSNLASRVQSTVNRYEDRNGNLLWEDKGDGNYKLVVDGSEISTYMRQATVAIEDREFYNHKGVDLWALLRSGINNLKGGGTQGGSTLTQQLIKQVYFADEAQERGLAGIPRKIKEMILAIEVERIYDKEEIITLYLNESPYGGRRNGVESGAQTYFGKNAKDLGLAESALLAAIPNNPAVLNPYNVAANEMLIERQHRVLDAMVQLGFITSEEAVAAKEVPILDTLRSEEDQYQNIKAPHFVLEAKAQLENEFGVKTMRAGGYTIRLTLDWGAQQIAEAAVNKGRESLYLSGSDNINLSAVDVSTGQVIAMVGSIDWNTPVYGQQNSATSLLEPGSSIKPVVDYAPLFKQRQGVNYGPGSILKDENIDSIYCVGAVGRCHVGNFTGRFYGNVTIRQALASSLNIPAIKAMYINGIDDSIETARNLGDLSYCQGNFAGLSSAIGGGCAVRAIEHTNAYATFARGGIYKPLAYVLEVKDSNGDVVKAWEDSSTQAVDVQVAYMISDILHDAGARNSLGIWGSASSAYGFVIPGIWTATKTGTTENGSGRSKDYWVASYSPVVATTVWHGNHDGSALSGNDSMHVAGRQTVHDFMNRIHGEIYKEGSNSNLAGKWNGGMQINQPDGMQRLTVNGKTDIWPSWFNKNTATNQVSNMTFDRISKKLATDATPDSTRISMQVTKIIDPITRKESLVPEDSSYNANESDDLHKASDVKPVASVTLTKDPNAVAEEGEETLYSIDASGAHGTFALASYVVYVGDKEIKSGAASSDEISLTIERAMTPGQVVSVKVIDVAGYEHVAKKTVQ